MDHKTLVDAVVSAEWDMFSKVRNVGGTASCQMDPKTFRIMRSSQMDNWDDELLGSYLEDLLSARLEGRNLVTEKYARMMESTFPEEYARLADSLPPLDPAAVAQVEEIVAAHVAWKEALDARYPSLADRGRPLRSRDDRPGQVSMESYLRAELAAIRPGPSPSTIRPPGSACAGARAKPSRTCCIRCGSTALRISRARKSISAPAARRRGRAAARSEQDHGPEAARVWQPSREHAKPRTLGGMDRDRCKARAARPGAGQCRPAGARM